ncbi:DUF5997 family protein [Corynebacterium bovis]|uniref:DUF5997 family protein n=1 Tax=Corynebacterium bovis TaxID=36808 RepID=UPI000F6441FA|nr:DUF5997 family protein [Corynebacterium bovis]RRO90316.1 hypothetical protein CXF30_00760 [Corynebacterium bovis]
MTETPTSSDTGSAHGGPPMKPLTAAKKLAIYLPAAPAEFRETPLSHDAFVALQKDPPEWLRTLWREGPHPRPEVARRLGVTIAALKRNDLDRPLTSEEISRLLAAPPEWLTAERRQFAEQKGAAAADDADTGDSTPDDGPGTAAAAGR